MKNSQFGFIYPGISGWKFYKKIFELPAPSDLFNKDPYTIYTKDKPKFTSLAFFLLHPAWSSIGTSPWRFSPRKSGGEKDVSAANKLCEAASNKKLASRMIPCKIMMNLAVHILHVFPNKKKCILPPRNETNRDQKFRGFGKCIIGVIWGT